LGKTSFNLRKHEAINGADVNGSNIFLFLNVLVVHRKSSALWNSDLAYMSKGWAASCRLCWNIKVLCKLVLAFLNNNIHSLSFQVKIALFKGRAPGRLVLNSQVCVRTEFYLDKEHNREKESHQQLVFYGTVNFCPCH
jgi:hypothetical protein